MESTPLLHPPSNGLWNLAMVNVVMVFTSLGTQITSTVLPQYMYHRTGEILYSELNISFDKDHTKTVCFQNTSDPKFLIQTHVQEVTTEKLTNLLLFNSIPVLLSVVIMGACVDYLGRKVVFLVSLFGHFSRNLCLTVVVFWQLDTHILYIGYGIDAICGGFCVFLLVGQVFTADETETSKSRTFAMGILTVSSGIANTFGYIITGYFIQNFGFFYPMLIAVIVTLIAILVIIFFVSETSTREGVRISPIRNMFRFYYHECYTGKRFIFWLAALGMFFSLISAIAAYDVDILYKLNAPFCWSPVKIGWFSTASVGITCVMGLILLRILQQYINDGTIALLGVVSVAAMDSYVGFCYTSLMLYLAPLIGMLSFGTYPAIRSIISQMVNKDRHGAIFASIAFVEAICYSSGNPIFHLIYKATLMKFRGAIFQVMTGMHIISFFLFLLLIYRRKVYERGLQVI